MSAIITHRLTFVCIQESTMLKRVVIVVCLLAGLAMWSLGCSSQAKAGKENPTMRECDRSTIAK